MKKNVLPAVLLLLLIAVTAMNSWAAISPGTAAPDFTLPTTTGEKVTLSQFKGQVVILAFWKSD